MSLATGVAALSFMPGMQPHQLPALGHARLQAPAMLLESATVFLADAASSGAVLMPEATKAAANAAARTSLRAETGR